MAANGNRRANIRAEVALAACAALLLAAVTGCDWSNVYGQKFDARWSELRKSSDFAVLGGPTDLETDGTHVNVRIPMGLKPGPDLFTKSFTPLSALDGKRIPTYEVTPSFLMEFPGLKVMFKAEVTDPKNPYMKFPAYLYIGDGKTASLKGKLAEGETFPYKEWKDRIQRGLHDSKPGDWETVDNVKNPKGEPVPGWKRLVAHGNRPFDTIRNSTPETTAFDGHFEMWVYESPQWIGILGWWCPEQIADIRDFKIEDFARLTAGTVEVTP